MQPVYGTKKVTGKLIGTKSTQTSYVAMNSITGLLAFYGFTVSVLLGHFSKICYLILSIT